MFTIYSKEKCSQCDSAKLLCTMKGVKFEVKILDKDFTREQLLEIAPRARSFPVIFYTEDYDGVKMYPTLLGDLNKLQQVLCGS